MEEGKKSELEEFPGFHLLMCDKNLLQNKMFT